MITKRTKLIKTTCYIFNDTVESFEFVVAQLSWYSLVTLLNKFTSSTKTKFQRVSFLTEAENLRILKIASPQITKNPQSTKIGPHKFKRFHTKQIEFFFKLTQSFNRF